MMRLLLASAMLFSRGNANVNIRESVPAARALQKLGTLDEVIRREANLTTWSTAFDTAMLPELLCTDPGCNFTVFAPTNDAFLDLNQDFLKLLLKPSWIRHLQNFVSFHVTFPTVSGDRFLTSNFSDGQNVDMLNNEVVTINILKRGITLTSPLTEGADIIESDILASNGAVNKIDSVLSPGFFGVDVFALGDEYVEFTLLQELIELVGLAGTEGEFTVLAPSNDAFLALGSETLEALKNDTETLSAFLKNHVIVGVFPSMLLTDGMVLETLSGLELTVSITDSPNDPGTAVITFNDATVIFADILGANGVAHAISSVILDEIELESENGVDDAVLAFSGKEFPSLYDATSSGASTNACAATFATVLLGVYVLFQT